MNGETFSDKDLVLTWGFFKQDLKVSHKGTLVYNSVNGFAHEALSPRQVSWITEHYNKTRVNYVF